MARMLFGCLLAQFAFTGVAVALLLFYPKSDGFTITTSRSTHYIAGGEFLSAAILCLFDLAIGIYLLWSFLHLR